MALNPESNRIEPCVSMEQNERLTDELAKLGGFYSHLVKVDGTPVPKTWTTFTIGELVEIKGSTFRVAYIGETSLLFEPVKPTDAIEI